MAVTTLGAKSVGSLVTIQESSVPAQFYVAYQGYKDGITSNPDNMTLLVRKGAASTVTFGSGTGSTVSGSEIGYRWTDTNVYKACQPYYDSTLTDPIKEKIPTISYRIPNQSDSQAEDNRYPYTILQGKIFVPSAANFRTTAITNYWELNSDYDYFNPDTHMSGEIFNGNVAAQIIINSGVPITTSGGLDTSTNNNLLYRGYCGYDRNSNTTGGAIVYRLTGTSTSSIQNILWYRIRRVRNTAASGDPTLFLPCFLLPNNVKVFNDGSLYAGPYDTTFTNVPNLAMQGQPITITWNAANEATSYSLQRSTNGGTSWETVYTGADLTFTETVGEWTQLQYQVAAVNADGTSPYNGSGAIEVITSQVLAISGTDSDLGTIVSDITYTVSTNTGNQIHLQRTVNGVLFAELDVNSGFSYDIPVIDLPTGQGEIVISASTTTTGGQPYSTTRTWQYEKQAIAFSNNGGISELTENNVIVWPATVMEAVKTYDFMGGTLDKTLIDIFNITSNPVVKWTEGTYVGTGTYGSGNPCSLSFESRPLYVWIFQQNGQYRAEIDCYALTNKYQNYGYRVFYSTNLTSQNLYALVDGANVNWYVANVNQQMNQSGQKYSYFAILA